MERGSGRVRESILWLRPSHFQCVAFLIPKVVSLCNGACYLKAATLIGTLWNCDRKGCPSCLVRICVTLPALALMREKQYSLFYERWLGYCRCSCSFSETEMPSADFCLPGWTTPHPLLQPEAHKSWQFFARRHGLWAEVGKQNIQCLILCPHSQPSRGEMVIPILQLRKQRLQEGTWLAQGYAAQRNLHWISWYWYLFSFCPPTHLSP